MTAATWGIDEARALCINVAFGRETGYEPVRADDSFLKSHMIIMLRRVLKEGKREKQVGSVSKRIHYLPAPFPPGFKHQSTGRRGRSSSERGAPYSMILNRFLTSSLGNASKCHHSLGMEMNPASVMTFLSSRRF